MTASILPPPIATAPEDEIFTIPGLSWEQYVAISDALGDRGGLRTFYADGSMTFLSPARKHEWSGDAIDEIVKTISVGCDIECDVVASTTLRKREIEHALEGDKVYYLGENATLMAGPLEIDLAIHPPPDLAIEVENSRRATSVVPIYARLGVPEVWRLDVRRQTLTFGVLRPDATYEAVSASLAFPFLAPADVLDQLRRAEESKSRNRWFLQLNDWVRDVIRPRLDPA